MGGDQYTCVGSGTPHALLTALFISETTLTAQELKSGDMKAVTYTYQKTHTGG